MEDEELEHANIEHKPKMQVAAESTRVPPVTRGPTRAAVVSGALSGVAASLLAAAGYVQATPALAAVPWLAPALVLAGVLSFVGSSVCAALAGVEPPKPPHIPPTRRD
jgi:hypothetical protein